MVTIRAVRRSFRFVPKSEVVEIIEFCFALCAKKYKISVHEFVWLSNHAHILLTDRCGCLPRFVQDMNSLISRNLNALHGENGTNFEKGYNIVTEIDDAAILKHSSYILANPCAANLVPRAKDWKGVTSWSYEYGEEMTFKRPDCGIWSRPKMPNKKKNKDERSPEKALIARQRRWKTPEEVTLKLERPPMFEGQLDDRELRNLVREETAKLEEAARCYRKKNLRRILGWDKVIRQKRDQTPRSREDMFGPEPRVAGGCKWARIEAAKRSMAFLQSYREALAAYINGEKAVFPPGTWKMRVLFQVPCGTSLV